MSNRDTAAIRAYHERTKHSVASVRQSRHYLDWDNMPRPFKVYPDLEPIPLPHDFSSSARPALAAIVDPGAAPGDSAPVDRAQLAHLLHFSAGVVRRRTYPGGEIHYRAAACTGALYHIDVYLVCGPLADLDAGVYHFGAHDFALRRLRLGDFRAAVVDASGAEPALRAAPAVLVCTSTFWRNAWKYQARTYRHAFWDAGTLLANLLAVAAARRVAARVVVGFADAAVNRLLDLDVAREVALALVPIGGGAPAPPPAPDAGPLGLETLPLSSREVDYPAIGEAHAASSLDSAAEATAWRAPMPAPPAAVSGPRIPLTPLPIDAVPESIEAVILRRGSTRAFAGDPIGMHLLSTILWAATRDIPADWRPSGTPLAQPYLIVNAVDGLAPGAYAYDPRDEALVLLREGDFRREAGFLDLGQELAADAAVDLYWLAALDGVLAHFGGRGYRAAQLEAAIAGGRSYLATYALGLGATGLTFFDDEVTAFFSPHAAGKSVMFLVAVGRPRRRRT